MPHEHRKPLDTNSPILHAMLEMRPNPETSFSLDHRRDTAGPILTRTDSVVPYTSSHLDGVESELMVRSDHGVQKDPEAIIEVRRILRHHIGLDSPSSVRGIVDAAQGGTSKEPAAIR